MRIRKPIESHQPMQINFRGKLVLALRVISRGVLLILLLSLIAACSAEQGTPAPGDPGDPNDPGGQVDPATIDQAWQASAHASTYVLDDAGENNACARCHAPINFMPSIDEIPEACFTCKFEVRDPEPLIAEADWVNIPCYVCHEGDADDVDPGIAWLEMPLLESYAEVGSANELCLKCHGAESIPGHKFPLLGGAHADYQCTQCHDAHGTTASCDDEACHADVIDPAVAIPGHDDDHQDLSCWACHDAGGLEVAPDQDLGYWTTVVESISIVSHDLVKEASCERCHFADNPWSLSVGVNQP
jgi:hypothetical protein